jgi:hypothetical protein
MLKVIDCLGADGRSGHIGAVSRRSTTIIRLLFDTGTRLADERVREACRRTGPGDWL